MNLFGSNLAGTGVMRRIAEAFTPLEQRRVIGPNTKAWSLKEWAGTGATMTNFQEVLETGEVTFYTEAGSRILADIGAFYPNQYIDWDSDDAFTQALTTIRDEAAKRIEHSGALLLLEKSEWTREDRILWEKTVSKIVLEEIDKIPGMGDYRLADMPAYPDTLKRAVRYNDLSVDIENDSQTIEFDCEVKSAVVGVVMQQLDAMFLSPEAEHGNYKHASNYFYVNGWINPGSRDYDLGGHAFVASEVGIIEATFDPSSKHSDDHYLTSVDDDYRFKDLVRGEPFISSQGEIYGRRNLSMADVVGIRLSQGDWDLDAMLEKIDPVSMTADEIVFPSLLPAQPDEVIEVPSSIRRLAGLKAEAEKAQPENQAKEQEKYKEAFVKAMKNGHLPEISEFMLRFQTHVDLTALPKESHAPPPASDATILFPLQDIKEIGEAPHFSDTSPEITDGIAR